MAVPSPRDSALILAVSGGLAAAVLCTAPGTLSTGPVGEGTVDALGSWWFHWWVGEAVSRGDALTHTDLFFHPWGKDILRDTGANLVDASVAALIRAWFGGVVAWNALAWLILTTNAAAAGLWMRSRGPLAAVLATTVVALHPYPLFEISQGRPTQALLAPFICAIGVGAFALKRGGRSIWIAGGALALTGWSYWFHAGFAALALLTLAWGTPAKQRMTRLLGIGGVALLATAPAVLPLASALAGGEIGGALDPTAWWTASPDLTSAAGDPVQICTVGGIADVGFLGGGGWSPIGPALGIAAATATLLSALAGGRWFAMTLLAVAIAAGPAPGGMPNPIYLFLMSALPPFTRLYWPCRALAMTVPLAAVGVAMLVSARATTRPVRPHRARLVFALLLTAGVGGELWLRGQLPMGTWDTSTPAALGCLAGRDAAVIVLPYGDDHQPLLMQTVHGQPMLGGMNARSQGLVPQEQQDLRAENTYLNALLLAPVDPRDDRAWTPKDRAALGALGYRWIVLRLERMQDAHRQVGAYQRLRAARIRLNELAGPAVYRDEEIELFAPWGDSDPCAAAPLPE